MNDTATDASLRLLLRNRGYWRWSLAAQLVRLPMLMAPMAYVLASITFMGSPGPGGLLLAVLLIAGELTAPLSGRIIDRLGLIKWAPRALLVSAAGRLILVALFAVHAPIWALVIVVALFAGVSSGAGGVVRVMLGRMVPDSLMVKALAVDSSMVELVVICAPFAVTLSALAGGLAPLVVMSLATATGAVLLWSRGRSAMESTVAASQGEDEGAAGESADKPAPAMGSVHTRQKSLWRNRQYMFWLLVAVAFGHLLGTAEIGALPLARELGGNNAIASALIAVLAAASAIAGILYAWRSGKIKAGYNTQACVVLALMISGSLLIGFGRTWPLLFIGFFVLGMWTAPINTIRSHAAALAIPKNRQVEGFALLDSANGVGFAIPGLLLMVVPVSGMVGAGALTAVLTLVLAPVLLRARTDQDDPPLADAERGLVERA